MARGIETEETLFHAWFGRPDRGGTTLAKVADLPVAIGMPIVLATAYGDSVMNPERLHAIPVVRKPASMKSILTQLAEASRLVEA